MIYYIYVHDTILIHRLSVGELATNCYIIWSRTSHEGYVIDPGDDGAAISLYLLENQIQLKGILLTHGHFDHCVAILELQLNYPAPVYLHPNDQFLLDRAQSTAAHFLGRTVDPVPPETTAIVDGQLFPLGSVELRVLHTPGHTPGSVCFILEPGNTAVEIEQENTTNTSIIFTGDTLFSYGIEPLTHKYSEPLRMSESLDRLEKIGSEALILPGHGESEQLGIALEQRGTPVESID